MYGGRVDLRHLQPYRTAGNNSSASLALARARDQPRPRSVRCSAEPDTRRKPPEGAAPTADQMRSHLDLDLMATPLWVPVRLSAARGKERLERVIAKRNRGRLKSTKATESTRKNVDTHPVSRERSRPLLFPAAAVPLAAEGGLSKTTSCVSKDTLTPGIRPYACLLYTSPSPRDQRGSRMPSSA